MKSNIANSINIRSVIRNLTIYQKVGVALFVVLLLLPAVISEFLAFLAARYMIFGLLALSLGLIWGFAGILSFGQAAFFGIGAYAMAISFEHVSLVNPAYIAVIVTVIGTAALGYAVGWFYFNADVSDDYFVIVTLALPVILAQLATTFSGFTGGFEGIFLSRMEVTAPGVSVPIDDDRIFYYLVLFVLTGGYLLSKKVLSTHFGRVLVGIRENEERTKSLGYDTAEYKARIFTFSAVLAGIAGALYAQLTTFVTPEEIGFLLSTEVVIWVVLGGRGLLLGAIGGGVAVSWLSTQLSSAFPEVYILILGIVFIIIVVAFPNGIFPNLFKFIDDRLGPK